MAKSTRVKASKRTATSGTKKSTAKAATKKAAPKAPKASAKKTSAKATKSPAKRIPKKNSAKPAKADDAQNYRLNVGDAAPDFRLPATGGREIGLSDLRGAISVLYFYPKDNTPGCTLEGHDFRARHEQFRKAGARVLGVSADSIKSHEGFKSKCGFPFDLISDEGGLLARAFDVMQMKSMYGRSFEGIERSTFVVDASGVVRAVWRKVKVAGHADEVLAAVRAVAEGKPLAS